MPVTELSVIEKFLQAAAAMTPLGLAGLLAIILLLLAYALVHPKGVFQVMKDNHLTHVESSLQELVELSKAQARSNAVQIDILNRISGDIQYLKGRGE